MWQYCKYVKRSWDLGIYDANRIYLYNITLSNVLTIAKNPNLAFSDKIIDSR
jgi:hypothetical protein